MKYEPKIMDLHITEKCNFECRDCYVYDENSNDLPDPVIENIIEGAAEVGIECIFLSGGEPTLFPEKIKDYGELIRRKGMISGIATNGSFGVEWESRKKLIPYLGYIDLAQISFDIFHCEAFKKMYPDKNQDDYVKCIQNAALAFLSYAKTRVGVMVVEADNDSVNDSNSALMKKFFDDDYSKLVTYNIEIFLPHGRGAAVPDNFTPKRPFSEILRAFGNFCNCKESLEDAPHGNTSIGVSHRGVYFCSSPPSATHDYILMRPDEFEKYGKRIIPESIRRANNSKKVQILLNQGIEALYNKIKPDQEPSGITNCSVCAYSIRKLGGIL